MKGNRRPDLPRPFCAKTSALHVLALIADWQRTAQKKPSQSFIWNGFPRSFVSWSGVPPPASEASIFARPRSEEHTSELQSLMRISYAVFCLKKQTKQYHAKNN